MTESHKQHVLARFPEAEGKTFTLHEFLGDDKDVVDPFGGSIDVYRQTRDELEQAIEKLHEKL